LQSSLLLNLTTALPVFIIRHADPIVDEPKVDASLSVVRCNEGIWEPQLQLELGIELHGQTSMHFSKKNFGLKVGRLQV
jgi:hypothetical protein